MNQELGGLRPLKAAKMPEEKAGMMNKFKELVSSSASKKISLTPFTAGIALAPYPYRLPRLSTVLISLTPAIILSLTPLTASATPSLSLETAVSRAFSSHPEIQGADARAHGEDVGVLSTYFPASPKFGLMREKNLTAMDTMDSFSISQEIQFPAKYFLMASAQKSKARSARFESEAKRLEVRRRVLSAYYGLYSSLKIIELLDAQKETLRQISRIAETRHSTGAAQQQDEMKAHMELTKIEADLLLAHEESEAAHAEFAALLQVPAEETSQLQKENLQAPALKDDVLKFTSLARQNSKSIQIATAALDEKTALKRISAVSFFPDFNLTYRHIFRGAPDSDSNYAVGLEMTLPLWFLKQTSELRQASAVELEAEKALESASRRWEADVKILIAKVRAKRDLLELYRTALIPQATSTLSSSRSAYQAGRASFADLLDSDRTVYATQVAYFRTLTEFIETLTKLEEVTSTSLSSLPYGD